MEIMVGIALIVGPLIAGLFFIIGDLFIIGGYSLPFYFVAICCFAIIPPLIVVVRVKVYIYKIINIQKREKVLIESIIEIKEG